MCKNDNHWRGEDFLSNENFVSPSRCARPVLIIRAINELREGVGGWMGCPARHFKVLTADLVRVVPLTASISVHP